MSASAHVKAMDIDGRRILYRRPCWDDVDAYMACMNEFHAESMREHLWIPTSTLTLPEACDRLSGILKSMVLKQSAYLFVDVDGQLSGMGWVTTKSGMFGAEYAALGLQISSRARGLGIGKQLMLMLEDEARQLRARVIMLTVADANPAKGLYAKLGYSEVGRKPHFMASNFGKQSFDERSDLIEMIKLIQPVR